jgi:hypothetical protein
MLFRIERVKLDKSAGLFRRALDIVPYDALWPLALIEERDRERTLAQR